jgi:predicted small lipoprotein YifL
MHTVRRSAMRFALLAVVIFTLAGCSRGGSLPTVPAPIPAPTDPSPDPAKPSELTFVWVVVTEEAGSGACIRNASVEIVSGPGLGSRIEQNDDCSYWDPDYMASFQRLPAGANVKLRASAPGYATKELTVIPKTGPQTAVTIELSRIR